MKKNILLLTIAFASYCTIVSAQDSTHHEDEIATLLHGDISYGGFGGFMMDYSTIGNEFVFSNGGGGGVLLNRKFFIGGFGLSSVNNISTSIADYDRLEMEYGGMWLGYYFFPEKAVHIGLDAKVGWGSITYRENGFFSSRVSDGVYVINPGLNIGMNVTRWFKVNVGGGYRLVSGTAPGYLGSNKLSQPNVNLALTFGWFN